MDALGEIPYVHVDPKAAYEDMKTRLIALDAQLAIFEHRANRRGQAMYDDLVNQRAKLSNTVRELEYAMSVQKSEKETYETTTYNKRMADFDPEEEA